MSAEQYCEIQEVNYRNPFYTSTVIRKGSPLKEHIAIAYNWMRETGILKYQENFWNGGKPLCNPDEIDYTPVGMEDVASAFNMLLCGIALSLITLVVENIIYFSLSKNNLQF